MKSWNAVLYVCWLATTASVHGFVPTVKCPQLRLDLSAGSSSSSTSLSAQKAILVVGATGRTGRRVVQQLLGQGRPVRALVRNPDKAQQIFGTSTGLLYPPLEIVLADLGTLTQEEANTLVEGCESIISVSGGLRFSKLTDFLPWRLFRADVSGWCKDRTHPYYTNYLAQAKLIDAAETHKISRFVRLTGLSSGFSAFTPFVVLFCTLGSVLSRYHTMCEQYLRASTVRYVILRPGGLAENERNKATTNLQVDPSSTIPAPARVGRSDVAALAIAACTPSVLRDDKSYTLATRWVGEDVLPRPQAKMEDGFATATEALKQLGDDASDYRPKNANPPYGLAVCLFAYTCGALLFKAAQFMFRGVFLRVIFGS